MAIDELLVKLVSKLDDKGFKELDKLEKKADKQTRILSASLRNMFVGVIGNIGVKEIVDASVKLDSLKTSFAALAGSDAGGAEQLKYLREETQRLGQDFVTAAEAYKNLFSAGRGAGMNPDEIQQIFSSVLEAGTVLGSSQQQMQGALMALEQMISKGKVSMEELRRQLGNALPGAMQIAARAMHTTSEGLQEMLEAGLDSQKFVTAFANQLHYEFGDKAVNASHTLRAELARLENAVFDLKTSFLDGDAGTDLGKVIVQVTKILQSPGLKQSLNVVGKLTVFLLKNIRLIAGTIVIIGIRRLISTLALLRLELLTTTFAAGSLGAAMQLFVGGNIIAGIRAITAAMWATLRPIALWVAGLLLVIELIDTLRGKKTALGEIVESTPTVKEAIGSEKFQRKWVDIKKIFGFQKDVPVLQDSGMYNKDGSLKSRNNISMQLNQGAIQINTQSTDPQATREAVKTAMFDVFEAIRIRNGYPQTEAV